MATTPVFLPGESHGQREDPGGLQSMGWQRVGHNWATNTFTLLQIKWWSRLLIFFSTPEYLLLERAFFFPLDRASFSALLSLFIHAPLFLPSSYPQVCCFGCSCQATVSPRYRAGHLVQTLPIIRLPLPVCSVVPSKGTFLRARQRGLPGTAFPRAAGLWGLILRARQRGLPGIAFPRAAGLRGLIHTSSRHTLVLLKELTWGSSFVPSSLVCKCAFWCSWCLTSYEPINFPLLLKFNSDPQKLFNRDSVRLFEAFVFKSHLSGHA